MDPLDLLVLAQNDSSIALQILAHKQCPDVNAKDHSGSTALHEACHRGMEGVVRKLLAKGASVVLTDYNGWTPLQVQYSMTRDTGGGK